MVGLRQQVQGGERLVAADLADREHRAGGHVLRGGRVARELLEVGERGLLARLPVGLDRALANGEDGLVARDLLEELLVGRVAAAAQDRDRLGAHVRVGVARRRLAEQLAPAGEVTPQTVAVLLDQHAAQVRVLFALQRGRQQVGRLGGLGQVADERGLERHVLELAEQRAHRAERLGPGDPRQGLAQEQAELLVLEAHEHVLQGLHRVRAHGADPLQERLLLAAALEVVLEPGARVAQPGGVDHRQELLERPRHLGVRPRARRQLGQHVLDRPGRLLGRGRLGGGLDRLGLGLRAHGRRRHGARLDRGGGGDLGRADRLLGPLGLDPRGLDRGGRRAAAQHGQRHAAHQPGHPEPEQERERLAALA